MKTNIDAVAILRFAMQEIVAAYSPAHTARNIADRALAATEQVAALPDPNSKDTTIASLKRTITHLYSTIERAATVAKDGGEVAVATWSAEVGMLVRHIRTGNLYQITALAKCKINEQWTPVVVYRATNAETFVRETGPFHINFECAEAAPTTEASPDSLTAEKAGGLPPLAQDIYMVEQSMLECEPEDQRAWQRVKAELATLPGAATQPAREVAIPWQSVTKAIRAAADECKERGAMFPQSRDEQEADERAAKTVIGTIEWLATKGGTVIEKLAAWPRLAAPISEDTGKDWLDGNYMCTCMACKAQFMGHKRCLRCKECDAPAAPSVSNGDALPELPKIPRHPEKYVGWLKSEAAAIEAHGKACVLADRAARSAAVSQLDKLLTIIAAAYIICGAHDVPDHILDVLCNPEAATNEQVEAMLPYIKENKPKE